MVRGAWVVATIGALASWAGAQTFLGALGERGFYITDSAGTVGDARAVAQSMGPGYCLASLHSDAEQAFVSSIVQPYFKVWLGLNDEAQEGLFVWEDGSPLDYTFWGVGQPNNTDNRDWVYLDATDGGAWKTTVSEGVEFVVPIQGLIAGPVPELGTMAAWAAGLGALALRRR